MEFKYPPDLAQVVIATLQSQLKENKALETTDPVCIPSDEQIKILLNVAFMASLGREEGEQYKLRLFYYPNEMRSSRITHLPFKSSRPFTSHEITKLAPAVPRACSAMCVRQAQSHPSKMEIWGITHPGRDSYDMRDGKPSMSHRVAVIPDPGLFGITINSPGSITVDFASVFLGELVSGKVSPPKIKILTRDGLIRRHLLPMVNATIAKNPKLQIRDYIGCLRQVVKHMQSSGVGGTLIVGDFESIPNLAFHGNYVLERPNSEMITHLQQAADFREKRHSILNRPESDDQLSSPDNPHKFRDYDYSVGANLEHSLQKDEEIQIFVAGLGKIDGALLLNYDLEVFGFGVKLTARVTDNSLEVRQPLDIGGKKTLPFDINSLGTRHGSAANFCFMHPGTLGIVTSQDGPTRAMLRPTNHEPLLIWTAADLSY